MEYLWRKAIKRDIEPMRFRELPSPVWNEQAGRGAEGAPAYHQQLRECYRANIQLM